MSEAAALVEFEVVFLGHTGKVLISQGPYKAEIDALTAVKELKPKTPHAKTWEIRRITRAVIRTGEVIVHH